MEFNAIEAKDIRITGGKVIAVCDEFQGKRKGSCYIYAYAQNGVSKKIKITVK